MQCGTFAEWMFTSMREMISVPSADQSVNGMLQKSSFCTHLDYFPPASELVVEFLLDSCDHCRIVTLFYTVLRTDHDFARLCIPEEKHLLCRKCYYEHGDVVLQDLSC